MVLDQRVTCHPSKAAPGSHAPLGVRLIPVLWGVALYPVFVQLERLLALDSGAGVPARACGHRFWQASRAATDVGAVVDA